MRGQRAIAIIAAAAMLVGCATADDHREACRAEAPDTAGIEDCAERRADSANTQAAVLTVLGIVVVGAIAAAAAGAGGGGGSRNDHSGLCAVALKRC
jgi:hypothetical protein